MTISAYCAGKFAVEGFGESLAQEVAPFGICVSLIEPGLVMTPHFTRHRGRAPGATKPNSPYYRWFVRHERMVDNILRAGRISPADVAKAVRKALTVPATAAALRRGRGSKADDRTSTLPPG